MIGGSSSRILTIYPITRGFAYCVLNGPGDLFDWGIRHVKAGEKNKECLSAIEHLIVRFDPHCIVTEDWTDTSSRRSARVKHLYRDVEKLADRANLDCYAYPWLMVFKVFADAKPHTRHDIAIVLADVFPALKRRLPPKRKAWLPTDPRQALFDAAALGIAHYAVNG